MGTGWVRGTGVTLGTEPWPWGRAGCVALEVAMGDEAVGRC